MAATRLRGALGLVLLFASMQLSAAMLPEDRVDILYHGYDGGGLDVTGPMVLVRKGFQETVSVWGHYNADIISSASIDVVTTASAYEEKRQEYSLGVDYLRGKTLVGLSYFNSEEDDYTGQMASIGISQDFFGDLTTLGVGYAFGWDTVRQRGAPEFEEKIRRHNYRLELSQVMTRNLVMGLSYEAISDQGFLNSPYRQVRYQDGSARGYSYESEVYPRTRTSSAVALRGRHYLPYRAAVGLQGRRYNDSWGMSAFDVELDYSHPWGEQWLFEGRYRYYRQTSVDFFSDLFPYAQAQNFMARDKDLSAFDSHALGLGAKYRFQVPNVTQIQATQISLYLDFIRFSYDEFRDLRKGEPVGEERFYGYTATVLRAYLTFFF